MPGCLGSSTGPRAVRSLLGPGAGCALLGLQVHAASSSAIHNTCCWQPRLSAVLGLRQTEPGAELRLQAVPGLKTTSLADAQAVDLLVQTVRKPGMQDRADGRPMLAAALATRQPNVGVCCPSAAWRDMLLEPSAFDWLQQLMQACHSQPGLSTLAAPARQLLVRLSLRLSSSCALASALWSAADRAGPLQVVSQPALLPPCCRAL